MQAYSDPKRESDPHALPDVEVFYRTDAAIKIDGWVDDDGEPMGEGWYYWNCLPGCLPDSDPIGPFATEAEALADAQQGSEPDDDGVDCCDCGEEIDGEPCHIGGDTYCRECAEARRSW